MRGARKLTFTLSDEASSTTVCSSKEFSDLGAGTVGVFWSTYEFVCTARTLSTDGEL